VFEVWWAYYQCEPFGSHWEQTASLAATIHGTNVVAAAARGVKMEALSVVDFMPSDSMKWKKRTRLGSRGIKHPKAQEEIFKRAFGFA
jgi:hypothetical protein